MARDCECCWQCGSKAHMRSECDLYTRMFRTIMSAHGEVRSLAIAAEVSLKVGALRDCSQQLAEIDRVLATTDGASPQGV